MLPPLHAFVNTSPLRGGDVRPQHVAKISDVAWLLVLLGRVLLGGCGCGGLRCVWRALCGMVYLSFSLSLSLSLSVCVCVCVRVLQNSLRMILGTLDF